MQLWLCLRRSSDSFGESFGPAGRECKCFAKAQRILPRAQDEKKTKIGKLVAY